MSLISQNPVSRNIVKARRDDEMLSIHGDNKDTENELESDSEITKLKKRKKQKEDKIEEKEMKRLENFLFGSIYSLVEFGKQVDENDLDVLKMVMLCSFWIILRMMWCCPREVITWRRLRAQHSKLNLGTESAELDFGLRNDRGYDSITRYVPLLCNSTFSTDSSQSNQATNDFCSEVWDTCQNVSILNSPFAPSLQLVVYKDKLEHS